MTTLLSLSLLPRGGALVLVVNHKGEYVTALVPHVGSAQDAEATIARDGWVHGRYFRDRRAAQASLEERVRERGQL